MTYFWQDLGKFSWRIVRIIIVFAGICFLLLIIYFRPELYVKNIFKDFRDLKLARESFEEKNKKIINEIEEIKKRNKILEKKVLEKQGDALKWQVNIEKRIENLEELKKEEKQKEEEEENLMSK
ncbi:MAG: hypothetical protein Q8O41_10655 [Candidatus Methanoperedens sp.]|nr:hypothetical protein [Candidatus Methanoperedens sp.]